MLKSGERLRKRWRERQGEKRTISVMSLGTITYVT